jgi:hypothetical protein
MLAGVRAGRCLTARSARRCCVAPQDMLDAIERLYVDVEVGLSLGVGGIVSRINRVFTFPLPRASSSGGSTEGQQCEIIEYIGLVVFVNTQRVNSCFLPGSQ